MKLRWLLSAIVVLLILGTAVDASAQNAQTLGFKFTPNTGPPGTRVHFEGTVPTDANDFGSYQAPLAYGLSALDVPTNPADCNLIVSLEDETVTATADGHVTGSFIIGRSGSCFMSSADSGADSGVQPARPGTYYVLLSCHACTPAGTITITSNALPRTGRASAPLAATAGALISTGTALIIVARRRRRTLAHLP